MALEGMFIGSLLYRSHRAFTVCVKMGLYRPQDSW